MRKGQARLSDEGQNDERKKKKEKKKMKWTDADRKRGTASLSFLGKLIASKREAFDSLRTW